MNRNNDNDELQVAHKYVSFWMLWFFVPFDSIRMSTEMFAHQIIIRWSTGSVLAVCPKWICICQMIKSKQKTSAAFSLSDEWSLHFCFNKNHKICWRQRSTGEMRTHNYMKVDDNSYVLRREFETKTNTMLDAFTLFFCAMRWIIIFFISYNCLLAVKRLMPTLSTKRITIDWGRQQLDKTVVGWMRRWTPHCGHRLHFYRLKMTNSIINAAPNTQSTEACGTSGDSQLPHRMSQQTVYLFFIFWMYDMHVHEFGRLPFSSFSLYLYLRLFSLSLCVYVCVFARMTVHHFNANP